jgi:hypothetical protein
MGAKTVANTRRQVYIYKYNIFKGIGTRTCFIRIQDEWTAEYIKLHKEETHATINSCTFRCDYFYCISEVFLSVTRIHTLYILVVMPI